MKTYAFNVSGRCLWKADLQIDAEDVTTVYSEFDADPNAIWYDIKNKRIEHRHSFPVQISTNKIENIPIGTTLTIEGVEVLVNDGVFEIEVDMPQTVHVFLDNLRFLMTEVEVPCEVQN